MTDGAADPSGKTMDPFPWPTPALFQDSVLLLDEAFIEQTRNTRRVFHAPVKDPAGPVISKTQEWEGYGPYTWGSRLHWNPATSQYELFYAAWTGPESNYYNWGLATSRDGLQWEKPALRVESFEGRVTGNMLPQGPHPKKALRSALIDPRPDCPAAERFKAIRFTYEGEYVSFSADGRTWREHPGNPVWSVPSDIIHAMWDPGRGRFVCYYKVWEVHGQTPDPGAPGGFRPVVAHMPFFEIVQRDDGLAELCGPFITFCPQSHATVSEGKVLLRSASPGANDGGGGQLQGDWHSHRVIAWAESEDFIHWEHERVVLSTDELDRPDANIQFMFVFLHGRYYLAFLTLHDERGHFEQQLAFSRDGLSWSRPWRGHFIGLGPPGAFDSGMVLAPVDPVVTDNQAIFHYGGFDLLHHQSGDGGWSAHIGRCMLRRDGYCSLEPEGRDEACIRTRALQLEGGDLYLNADAQGGQIRVEVLDDGDRVIPGYEAANGVALQEDTSRCRQCMSRVAWRGDRGLSELSGRTVKLRIFIRNAKLYSFALRRPERA